MADIPEDLTVLKRPALQKLSKKYGLKANGKVSKLIIAMASFCIIVTICLLLTERGHDFCFRSKKTRKVSN